MREAHALKVHALDALALDAELVGLLSSAWAGVCRHAGEGIAARMQPELQALLRGALWYLSIWRARSCTPGQAVQNLQWITSEAFANLRTRGPLLESSDLLQEAVPRWRRLGYGLLVVILPWAWARAVRAHRPTSRIPWPRAVSIAESPNARRGPSSARTAAPSHATAPLPGSRRPSPTLRGLSASGSGGSCKSWRVRAPLFHF